MGWSLRGFEVIDVNGRLHSGHDPIDLARPFAPVLDNDDQEPKATAKHDKWKNGTKCADSGTGRKHLRRRRQAGRPRCCPVCLQASTRGVCARARDAATDSAEVGFADAVKIDTVTPSPPVLAQARHRRGPSTFRPSPALLGHRGLC